jgi:myo-inositol-1(or 4)-monophosphatase
LNHWDLAAGLLICERAGLAYRRLEASPPAGDGVLLAPPALLEPLAALVG